MIIRKSLSMFLAIISLCSALCFSSHAVEMSTYEENGLVSEYTIGRNPVSMLIINQGAASCTSKVDGFDCMQISVTQTLQKYSGWLWIWDDVPNASWSKTVNLSSISLSNSKSGLSSGTYRLMSVFTLTNSNGQTEIITIYSSEKTVS